MLNLNQTYLQDRFMTNIKMLKKMRKYELDKFNSEVKNTYVELKMDPEIAINEIYNLIKH